MCREYQEFRGLNAEILAIASDTLDSARKFFETHTIPFPSLIDEDHHLYDLYNVQDRALSLGRRLAPFIVDGEGNLRYAQPGTQQWQIPGNSTVLSELSRL